MVSVGLCRATFDWGTAAIHCFTVPRLVNIVRHVQPMRQNVQYEITSKMPRKFASDWGYAPDFIRVTYDAFQWMGYLSQTPTSAPVAPPFSCIRHSPRRLRRLDNLFCRTNFISRAPPLSWIHIWNRINTEFNHFLRVIHSCSCLPSLVDIRLRVRE